MSKISSFNTHKPMSNTSTHIIQCSAILIAIAAILISIGHIYAIPVGVFIGYATILAMLVSIVVVSKDSTPKY